MLSGRWNLTLAVVVPSNKEHCCYYMVLVRHVDRKGAAPGKDGKKNQIFVGCRRGLRIIGLLKLLLAILLVRRKLIVLIGIHGIIWGLESDIPLGL